MTIQYLDNPLEQINLKNREKKCPKLRNPIRVMELRSTYRWGGGPDKTILNSAALHDSSKIITLIVYLRSDTDNEFVLAQRGRKMGLTVIEIVEKRIFDFSTVKKIIALINEYNIDIIHSRDYKSNLFALIIRKFFKRPIRIITTAHGWVGKGYKLVFYYSLDKILASFFDRNLVLFQDQVKQFIRKPNPKTTIVVHNGIDHKDWDPSSIAPGSFRHEMSISESTTFVGFVGRIMPEKDILTLVAVADEIVNNRKRNAIFVCIGESNLSHYERTVMARIKAFKLEDKFRLLGVRFDLKQIYRDLDIFIMTSIQEGFPNSLLEAMAMEVPSVVSGVDGIPEILKNRVHGFILKPGDISGFADAIEELIDNRKLCETFVNNSRKKVADELSFEYRLKKMEKIYYDLFAEMNAADFRLLF